MHNHKESKSSSLCKFYVVSSIMLNGIFSWFSYQSAFLKIVMYRSRYVLLCYHLSVYADALETCFVTFLSTER